VPERLGKGKANRWGKGKPSRRKRRRCETPDKQNFTAPASRSKVGNRKKSTYLVETGAENETKKGGGKTNRGDGRQHGEEKSDLRNRLPNFLLEGEKEERGEKGTGTNKVSLTDHLTPVTFLDCQIKTKTEVATAPTLRKKTLRRSGEGNLKRPKSGGKKQVKGKKRKT